MSKPNENNDELKLGDVTITFPRIAAERIYEDLKKIVSEGPGVLTSTNVVTFLISLMQTVDGYCDLEGAQKKAVALAALTHLIDDQMEEGEEKEQFKQLVLTTLPSVVNTFINLDKKKLKIKNKKTLTRCLACFFPNKKPNASNFYSSN